MKKVVESVKFSNKYEKWSFWSLITSMFLLKLIPFYVLPIKSILFSSHTIGKLGIILSFFLLFVYSNKKSQRYILDAKKAFWVVFLYLFGQSISVLSAWDLVLFWKVYHNILISLLVYFLGYWFAKDGKFWKVYRLIVLIGLVTVGVEFVLFWVAAPLKEIFELIIQEEFALAFRTDLSRGRQLYGISTELFIPIFSLPLIYTSLFKRYENFKNYLILGTLLALFLSISTNFRSRALIAFVHVSLVMILIFLDKNILVISKIKIMNLISFSVIGAVLIGSLTSNSLFSFNVFERFMLKDVEEDVSTITFRADSFSRSVDMFRSSPLVGVGLGNYGSNLIISNKLSQYSIQQRDVSSYNNLAYRSPHNMIISTLSETGTLGIFGFLIMMGWFIFKDLILLRGDNMAVKSLIFSYWGMILFMQFNPSNTFYVIGWSWMFRGLILGSENYS